MNKKRGANTAKARLCIQYDDHSRAMCSVWCSLMERQSLVDLAICCGNRIIHVHKCIMAAGSPYFREQLEKNPATQQVVINGLHFICLKSIIEFIYCGDTVVLEENMKFVIAAANLFEIQGLRALVSDENNAPGASLVYIPPPVFLNTKPKYSSTYVPITPISQSVSPSQAIYQDNDVASPLTYQAVKRNKKFPGDKDIGELEGFPMQTVNYGNMSTSMMAAPFPELNHNVPNADVMPFAIANTGMKTMDKNVFNQGMNPHMDMMYQMPENEYDQVANEVLRNMPNDTLQFDTQQLKSKDKKSRKFDTFDTLNSPYGTNAAASTSVDLDAIFFNLEKPNAEQTSSDSMESTSDESVRTFDHEHADILSEISSMQYYDNSVYEDVAEKVEMAFQRQQRQSQQEVITEEGKLPDLG